MANFVCTTCGTQFGETPSPPEACPICRDERQFVNPSGQSWTTHAQLLRTHRNTLHQEEAGLIGIGMEPSFGIDQRALLILSPQGNILWDCIALIDPGLVAVLQALGGLSAIAISHPHYYSGMVEWSRALGGVPVYLHQADREWVMRSDENLVFWKGETRELQQGVTLIRCGGHFPGGTVLHWAQGRGVLLSGDIVQVLPDLEHVSFMYSYPNLIPLPEAAVQTILERLGPFAFESIYGAWWDKVIRAGGKRSVEVSGKRYLRMLEEGRA